MPTDERNDREPQSTPELDKENKTIEDLSHGALEGGESDEVKGGMIRQRFRVEDI